MFVLFTSTKSSFEIFKGELRSALNELLVMDLDGSDDLCVSPPTLEKEMFNCGLKIKKLLASAHPSSDLNTTTLADGKGVKLPKLNVPTFDGQVVTWR